jgi:hypothetical protein
VSVTDPLHLADATVRPDATGPSDAAANIGDHVLGLPPEPRLDKTVPWSQVPRNP